MKVRGNVLFFSLVLFVFGGCKQTFNNEVKTISYVKVDQVKKLPDTQSRNFSGIFAAELERNLAFRVGGPIKRIFVKQGDWVQKGQLVAQMDERDYLIQLSVAKADYEKVTAETKRVSELYRRNSVTEVDYQKAIAGEKMIQAQLDHAQDQINDTKLYAPFSGIIQRVNFEEGELINTGMPIASILNTNKLEIAVDIPAKLFIQRNQFSKFYAEANSVSSEKIPLKLEKFEPKAKGSQLYQVIFSTDSDYPKQLAPGMEAKVVFELSGQKTPLFYVPTRAVFFDNQEACIWVLNLSDSTVTKKTVKTAGIYNAEFTKIAEGLDGNETIVVAGIHSLAEKQKVKPMAKASKTNVGGLL